MPLTIEDQTTLRTSAGDFPLDECRLQLAGSEWKILHVGAVLSRTQESEYLLGSRDRLPYGVTLWAAAIALAYEIASRAADFQGAGVAELGAGTGLPGIIAASQGARVLQTDINELVLALCRRNAVLNGVETIEQRLTDWSVWDETTQFEWIIGSDVLYSVEMHPHLRRIFEKNLSRNGKILLSDPFRASSLKLLESLEADGWRITHSKWRIGEDSDARPIGVFELRPPQK